MSIISIVTLLLATMGPIKISIMFSKTCAAYPKDLQRKVALRTTGIGALICLIFVMVGEALLSLFHIDLASLEVAGGIILLLYAIQMVMDSPSGKKPGPESPASADADHLEKHHDMSVAISPLAMPFFATPQALVAITTLSAQTSGFDGTIILVGVISAICVLNLLVMMNIGAVLDVIGMATVMVISKLAGILLLALAMQMIVGGLVSGLQFLGVIS